MNGCKKRLKTQDMVLMALMISLKMILSQFSIYITPTFKIFSLAYLPGAMVSLMYGPGAGILFGFAADTVGYLVKPAGPYFIGYALSEMTAGFIYGIFLYKKPLTVWRILASRVAILLTVTFGLNYLWSYLLYGAVAGKYYSWARIGNNLLQMPFSVILILAMGTVVLRLQKNYQNQAELVCSAEDRE